MLIIMVTCVKLNSVAPRKTLHMTLAAAASSTYMIYDEYDHYYYYESVYIYIYIYIERERDTLYYSMV